MSTFDLVTRIRADGSQASREFSQVGEGLKKLGIVALAALSSRELLQAGVALFNVGTQTEAFGRRYATVFGENTAVLDEWIEDQKRRFGMSKGQMEGAIASVGDLLVPMGLARDRAAEMSMEIMTLAGALSEWSGGTRSANEVTSILIKSLLGERDALKELGVSLSEEQVQAALTERGQQDLTGTALEQAKAFVTLELITAKSADALSAYNSGAMEGTAAAKSLESVLADLKETLGDLVIELAPAIEGFADLLGSIIGPNDEIQRMIDLSPDLNAALRENFGMFGGMAVQMHINEEAAEALNVVFGDMQTAMGAGLQEAFNLASGGARGVGEGISGAAGVMSVAVGQMVSDAIALKDNINASAEATRNLTSAMLANASPVFRAVDAVGQYNAAVEAAAALQLTGTASADELALSTMNVAEMALGAQAALDALGFDPTALDLGIGAIATSLGISEQAVRDLLVELGVLNEFDIADKVFNVYARGPDQVYMQHGGTMAESGMAVVGEAGPETLWLPKGATVTPGVRATSGSGGGISVSVYVAGSVLTEQDLADVVERQLILAARRGGLSEVI